MASVTVTNFANQILMWLPLIGLFTGLIRPYTAAWIMTMAWGVIMVFNLITLPVEFDASSRAKLILADMGYIGTDDEMDGAEGGEDSAIFDIKNAIADLEAAFAELEASQGGDTGGDEFDDKDGMDGEEEPMKMGFQEGRRMTREYTEKVGNDWEKNSQKAQGQHLGAGTGEKDGAPVEGKSPISSGAGKPVGGKNVGAGNIVRGDTEGQSNTGDRPAKVNKGINPESSEKFAKGIHNVDGAKSGVKTLSAVKGGHGAEKKGAGPGPVGSGTGDKAGQTSVPKVPQFLKPAN